MAEPFPHGFPLVSLNPGTPGYTLLFYGVGSIQKVGSIQEVGLIQEKEELQCERRFR